MERSYVCYSSLHGDRPFDITIGGNDVPGLENPKSYLCLNVTAVPLSCSNGHPIGGPVEVALELTLRQVAEIVKIFFADVIGKKFFWTIFWRLMAKRWAVMTDPYIKDPRTGGDEYVVMAYHRL